ncbi:CocE/NonD family hydrolase [Neobacillus niacini]|uniref:CocE/NonD family hydrolase n=1 Tax=Neobacillus niacini TaxID=86668 RepID=UPI0021CB9907|nr:CocE/NonD family hydrolase [Neobacillus niacini]MCM3763733.1 CocE/NonD family hydrolase [Neobacillus niacini]
MAIDQIIVEKNVPCVMRDGVTLYGDIYRPNQEGKFPVLLTRLPYNKDLPFYSHRYLDTNRLVRNGYVVIIQDVRGRFHSEGKFYPFLNEAEDGYDTVEWAAAQPYSNGKVGMFGLSYYGYTQLLAATEQPPHLKAIVPAMTLNDWRNNSLDGGGKFLVASSETWALESVAPEELKRKYGDSAEYAAMMEKMADFYNGIEEWYKYKPIQEWPPLKKLGAAGYFFDLLEGKVTEEMGERMSILNKYQQINVPAYHIAGWYDNLLPSTLKNFTELQKNGQGLQRLIIGPWGHGVFSSVIGERNFGLQSSGDWIDGKDDLTGLHIRWFDHWLKGEDTVTADAAPIRLFVMGVNEWRDEWEWPLARTTYVPYYLHSGGQANTRFGDGTLSVERQMKEEPADTFVYDPSNPVPTNGGGTLYAGVQTMGPKDQRQLEEREDVLVYTSEPLKDALEVTGPVKVKLWAKTDAVDTDFTAKLVDVHPDGTAYNLTDGIVRAQYRNGKNQGESIKDEIVPYEIELWPTSNVFLPGHCIRVEISSSNFPRYDTNLNTGETMITSSEYKVAHQTVYHGAAYPSYIMLPIIR